MAKRTFLLAGLGYGDEGKGRMCDYLVRRFGCDKVVRYNGGPQAAHNVVTPEGLHHRFSQFGSGTLVPGVKTYITDRMIFDPLQLILEDGVLADKGVTDALDRTFIDLNCYIVTPLHQLINQIRETVRGDKRHGSCGQGVGEATFDIRQRGSSMMLQVRDMFDSNAMLRKLIKIHRAKLDIANNIVDDTSYISPDLRDLKHELEIFDIHHLMEEYLAIGNLINVRHHQTILHEISKGNTIFEGAQGFLLHEIYGFKPHVCRSDTSFNNALELLDEAGYDDELIRLAVTRGYQTRHGAGPLVTHDPEMEQYIPPCHNHNHNLDWQGQIRLGWFDLLTARYALSLLGRVDGLAVTNLDRMTDCPKIKVATAYQHDEQAIASPLVRSWGLIQELQPAESVQVWSAPHALNRCRPGYKSEPEWRITDPDGYQPDSPYLKFLADRLKTPVIATAFGPTAKDTICLQP